LYRRFLEVFQRGITLAGENCERVEIPYEGKVISGLYTRANNVQGLPRSWSSSMAWIRPRK
jgi:hypothetical protein